MKTDSICSMTMTDLKLFVLWVTFFATLPPSARCAQPTAASPDDGTVATRWIWSPERQNGARPLEDPRSLEMRCRVELPGSFRSAWLSVVADFCDLRVLLDGTDVLHAQAYGPRVWADVTDVMRREPELGRHALTIEALPVGGPAAAAAELVVLLDDGTSRRIVTDGHWECRGPQGEGWRRVSDYGRVDEAIWNAGAERTRISPLDDYTQWKQALGEDAVTDPLMYVCLPGFEFERLRVAAPDQGSWVGMTFDPRGRLIVAREDQGLLRFSPPFDRQGAAGVETIDRTLKECRGLLFAHGALYAHANNSKALYRLRDTDGDDRFDEQRKLLETTGGVGHGRNDLALGPDGRIHAIFGDAVDIPREVIDRTSPLREHRRGEASREGFVLAIDPDGKNVEVLVAGLRNPYGLAFHRDGEMFTYDADAEYDMGSPWYRPTRVNQLLVGGDFGWRGVTGSWPPYRPDQPEFAPYTMNVGKGSPTAVEFGYDSAFPDTYRDALYILDWAYGRVLAVHLSPRGAGYVGRAETFVKGRPLNVTDIDFGPDGAMYLITGGRQTRSALYRVRHVGPVDRVVENPPTPQQEAREAHAKGARAEMRRLRKLIREPADSSLDPIWSRLADPDPRIRYTALCALEQLPVKRWANRALEETDPTIAPTALLALARASDGKRSGEIIGRLNGFSLTGDSATSISMRDKITALRVYRLCLDHKGGDESLRGEAGRKLDELYPDDDFESNRRLGELLVRLKRPGVVRKTLDLLDKTTDQVETMHYLYVLRDAESGWDDRLRRRYFLALRSTDRFVGGEGMPTFARRIRSDALENVEPGLRERYAELLERDDDRVDTLVAAAAGRPSVREWKLSDLRDDLTHVGRGRDYERGRRMFSAALCAACHRMGADGGYAGPDLSHVASRFSRYDLLVSILEPSNVVAPPYRSVIVETSDGHVLVGQPAERGDYRSPRLHLVPDALRPDRETVIAKQEIVAFRQSDVSPMPTGLLDTLTRQEILDLIAYLESGGDPRHHLYSSPSE